MSDPTTTAIVTLGFCLLAFLIIREIVCWYFKLNEITKLLKQIRDK